MVVPILLLIPLAMLVSAPGTMLVIRLGHKIGALDTEPIAGQVKMRRRRIPNTGGMAIFAAIGLPLAAGLTLVTLAPDVMVRVVPALEEHLPRVREQSVDAGVLLGCLFVLHVVGVVDDRRPLGPWIKLGVMLGLALVCVVATGSRLLTLLDGHVGGAWLSIVATVLWFGVVTNAMNFMDNMDGLSGGCAAVAASCFLVATLLNGQWLVAAVLALLIGALVGFLIFNFPPAKVFMGDGGSLVVGFALAFLTTRTTFYEPGRAGGWYGVFMPLLVLAIPLYDFVTVTIVRLRQGKSPFVGDLNHFSHRLRRRGLSTRSVALVVYGLTAATGIAGIVLGSLEPWQAVLAATQVGVLLGTLALLEFSAPAKEQPIDP